MIYAILRGRLGNQFFIYAFAKQVQQELGDNQHIVIDDSEVLKLGWKNSLTEYNLPDVSFTHDRDYLHKFEHLNKLIIFKSYHHWRIDKDYTLLYKKEHKWQPIFNKNGMIICENGYMPYKLYKNQDYLLDGYFQSEKYFNKVSDVIKSQILLDEYRYKNYPQLEQISSRNTVCVSIKVQHNVGNSIYDVCNDGYWEKAINYILKHVENPLFFVCSDNVQYVLDNLIDADKYDVVTQDSNYSVEVSLQVMALCKHFIIGNTTFGWWAQYLSSYQNKIVIAPSKWMKVRMPLDIYEKGWITIDV